jgi:hypothetical protein
MIKILYNDCFGGFQFSKEFITEYETRTKTVIGDYYQSRLYEGEESLRTDPHAIAIFEEKGSEWCSGTNAQLAIMEIPEIFARYWAIDEEEGDETVRVRFTDAYADILHTFIRDGDKAALESSYAAITAARDAVIATIFS